MTYFPTYGQESDDEGGMGLFVLLAGIGTFSFLFATVQAGIGLAKYNKSLDYANSTHAVLIERIRVPSANGRNAPTYYLRYKFDNPDTAQGCALDIKTKTTPSGRLCAVTVARVEVGKEAYQDAAIPSKIEILYRTSDNGTWSEPLDYPTKGRKIVMLILFGFLTGLLGIFTWKSARTL